MMPPKSKTTRFPFHDGSVGKDLRYHPSHIGLNPRAPPPFSVQGCSNWKSWGRSNVRQEESSKAGEAKSVFLFSFVTNWNFQPKLKRTFCCYAKFSKGTLTKGAFSCAFWYWAVTPTGTSIKKKMITMFFIWYIIIKNEHRFVSACVYSQISEL